MRWETGAIQELCSTWSSGARTVSNVRALALMVTIHETHCDAPGAQISTESQSRMYGACTCGAALGVRARARGWPALWWFASSPLRLVGLRMRMTQKSTRPKGALAVHQWPSAQISHAPHRELVTHPKGVPQLVTHMWPAHRGACAHVCVAAAAGSPADIDGPHHGKRTRADTSTTESHMRCWVQTYSRVHSVSTCICSGMHLPACGRTFLVHAKRRLARARCSCSQWPCRGVEGTGREWVARQPAAATGRRHELGRERTPTTRKLAALPWGFARAQRRTAK